MRGVATIFRRVAKRFRFAARSGNNRWREKDRAMQKRRPALSRLALSTARLAAVAAGSMLVLAGTASAQTGASPWENAVNVLQQAFTGTIAKGLGLVAIVVGGLTFAFGEGGGKRTFAGIVFGLGMAVLAVNFLNWLFGA
jgi:type IV secretion system protein TrbC